MGITVKDFQSLFNDIADQMAAERDNLCALDGAIGDADHGIAMEQGMKAAAKAANEVDDVNMQELFNAAAIGFLNAVGASSGPLYATAFMRAGKFTGPVTCIPPDDLRHVIVAMADGIQHRGKAEPGQKTMLDAWRPAAETAANGGPSSEIVSAAKAGAEATRDMIATLGRAARLGKRSIGHPDPGAVSSVFIISKICERF
ncbi:MAG: dihydroxyacetone kinase subunit DhaL [Roseibium sp.]